MGIEILSDLGHNDLCAWAEMPEDVWPWTTGPSIRRMYPMLNESALGSLSAGKKSSTILATVKCLKELKFDYKRILRELGEPSVRGESVPHPKTVGASETLADGEVRPGPTCQPNSAEASLLVEGE